MGFQKDIAAVPTTLAPTPAAGPSSAGFVSQAAQRVGGFATAQARAAGQAADLQDVSNLGQHKVAELDGQISDLASRQGFEFVPQDGETAALAHERKRAEALASIANSGSVSQGIKAQISAVVRYRDALARMPHQYKELGDIYANDLGHQPDDAIDRIEREQAEEATKIANEQKKEYISVLKRRFIPWEGLDDETLETIAIDELAVERKNLMRKENALRIQQAAQNGTNSQVIANTNPKYASGVMTDVSDTLASMTNEVLPILQGANRGQSLIELQNMKTQTLAALNSKWTAMDGAQRAAMNSLINDQFDLYESAINEDATERDLFFVAKNLQVESQTLENDTNTKLQGDVLLQSKLKNLLDTSKLIQATNKDISVFLGNGDQDAVQRVTNGLVKSFQDNADGLEAVLAQSPTPGTDLSNMVAGAMSNLIQGSATRDDILKLSNHGKTMYDKLSPEQQGAMMSTLFSQADKNNVRDGLLEFPTALAPLYNDTSNWVRKDIRVKLEGMAQELREAPGREETRSFGGPLTGRELAEWRNLAGSMTIDRAALKDGTFQMKIPEDVRASTSRRLLAPLEKRLAQWNRTIASDMGRNIERFGNLNGLSSLEKAVNDLASDAGVNAVINLLTPEE